MTGGGFFSVPLESDPSASRTIVNTRIRTSINKREDVWYVLVLGIRS